MEVLEMDERVPASPVEDVCGSPRDENREDLDTRAKFEEDEKPLLRKRGRPRGSGKRKRGGPHGLSSNTSTLSVAVATHRDEDPQQFQEHIHGALVRAACEGEEPGLDVDFDRCGPSEGALDRDRGQPPPSDCQADNCSKQLALNAARTLAEGPHFAQENQVVQSARPGGVQKSTADKETQTSFSVDTSSPEDGLQPTSGGAAPRKRGRPPKNTTKLVPGELPAGSSNKRKRGRPLGSNKKPIANHDVPVVQEMGIPIKRKRGRPPGRRAKPEPGETTVTERAANLGSASPAPRKRGRPPGSKSMSKSMGDVMAVHVVSVPGTPVETGEAHKRKRGRPPGSKNKRDVFV